MKPKAEGIKAPLDILFGVVEGHLSSLTYENSPEWEEWAKEITDKVNKLMEEHETKS